MKGGHPTKGFTEITRRGSEFFLYAAPDGAVKVRVLFQDETAWLTQRALAELFGVGVPAINKHLKSIFESGELAEDSVVSVLETTAADGKTYKTRFYNLDAIIGVGYRSEAHVKELKRIVSAYLDLAENRAQRGILMKMADWASFLNSFLELSSYPILTDRGKVSALEAKLKAEGEYEVFRRHQDAEYLSDFDRVVQEARRLEGKQEPKALGPGKGGKKR